MNLTARDVNIFALPERLDVGQLVGLAIEADEQDLQQLTHLNTQTLKLQVDGKHYGIV